MFHVELRQFPNVARAFNLERSELEARFLNAWVTDRPIELDERRFSPDKAKLTVYEGPQLAPEEMGLGRSWGNVTRQGEDVTERLIGEARAAVRPDETFKRALEARGTSTLPEVIGFAAAAQPGRRPSEQLALAEQAVWELLHQGRVTLHRGATELAAEQWQPVLLSWASWSDDELRLEPAR